MLLGPLKTYIALFNCFQATASYLESYTRFRQLKLKQGEKKMGSILMLLPNPKPACLPFGGLFLFLEL